MVRVAVTVALNLCAELFGHDVGLVSGAFVESCYEHCGAQTGANYDRYALEGVTMQEAHSKWWASESGADSAAEHTLLPGCELTADAGQCNPTCL